MEGTVNRCTVIFCDFTVYCKSMEERCILEIMEIGGGFTPGSNNMDYCGCSHESNAIYLEEIHSELMDIQAIGSYLTDQKHKDLMKLCSSQVCYIYGPCLALLL